MTLSIPSCETLIERILKYNPSTDSDLIRKAYDLCKHAHAGQLRKSGDPYYSHPIAVASNLIEMKMDDTTIVVGLLHDVLEDTDVTSDIIQKQFSHEIMWMVESVTTLDHIKLQPDHIRQAENFRKLFIAMSRDIRVLIVKLSDRLHNMRTIYGKKDRVSMRRIAIETLEIYAPLAERIGMYQMMDELQDLSFQVINSNARKSVLNKMQQLLHGSSGKALNRLKNDIKKLLESADITGSQTNSREKTAYSVWKKMCKKEISVNQLSDLIGIRIILQSVDDCYKVLGLIHTKYKAIRGSFVDYISFPKENGYESIHTTVMSDIGKIEIQIRSKDMDHEANYGLASHWGYKYGVGSMIDQNHRTMLWLQRVLGILEDSNDNASEFLESTKLELYSDQLFVFTSDGTIVNLPNGASVLDLAFSINDTIGLTCLGAKINDVIVGIDYKPKNGDTIDILTSDKVEPQYSWLNFIVTGRARTAIRKATSQHVIEQTKLKGLSMFSSAMKYVELDLKYMSVAKQILHKNNMDDVFLSIGNGYIDAMSLTESIIDLIKKHDLLEIDIMDDNINNMNLNTLLARINVNCCNVVNLDRGVPVIMPNIGVAWHMPGCSTLLE